MKEISRRAMSSGGAKKTTGLPLAYDVDAEIVVEDEGHIVYLHTSWTDSEMMSGISFEATTESLYDMYLEFDKVADDVAASMKVSENINRVRVKTDVTEVLGDIEVYERYAVQYQQLVQMMQEILDQDGVDCNLSELEE